MESFRVQQDIAMGKTTVKGQSKNQQAIINGDFFAAFLQLITQGGQEGELDILSQVIGSDTEENAQAMEMMAGLLSGNAGFNWFMNDSVKNGAENSELMNNVKLLQELMMAQGGGNGSKSPINELNAILSNVGQNPSQNAKQLDELSFGRQMQGFGDIKQMQADIELNTVTAKDSSNSSEMLFQGDMNFQNAIMQAQKLMKGQSKESLEISDDPSVDALQQAIGQSKFDTVLNDKQLSSSQTAVDVADLAEQVKNGLSGGALGERKEFSVKLKPEGLGEVTIKLIENQNKMTVSIVAATSEVAKLLNNELSTLRETMRAMQIDVRDVAVQPQNDFGSMQQNLQQQMSQGQFHQFGENRQSNRLFSEFDDTLEPDLMGIEPSYLMNEKMNIYV